MARKIDYKDFTSKDCSSLIYHMSVQSLLDLKAINGRVCFEDIMETKNMSVYSKTVLFNDRVAYAVFGIPSENSGQINLFIYATTEAYSKMSITKESLFNIINDLQKYKICSIIYKGNRKLQSLLRSNGFKYSKSMFFGRENRTFCLFVRE